MASRSTAVRATDLKRTRFYRLRVEFKGMLPMIDVIRARDLKQAQRFARNRYPSATAIISLHTPKPRTPRKHVLGEEVHPGQLIHCPRCQKRHKIAEPEEDGQRLLFINCGHEKIAVAIENRYLPQAN
jgi:hypothetical protein